MPTVGGSWGDTLFLTFPSSDFEERLWRRHVVGVGVAVAPRQRSDG